MMACFARILSESEYKNVSMKNTGSSIDKIQQAYSVVNTNITEMLLGTSFEALFEQISRYTRYIEHLDPIDWKIFVNYRNKLRFISQSLNIHETFPFEDEKIDEDKQKKLKKKEERSGRKCKDWTRGSRRKVRDKVEIAIKNKLIKKLRN